MGMSYETKRRVDEAPAVERMDVYELYENDFETVKRYAVVVCGGHRTKDRYVSIITLTDADTDTGWHADEVGVRLPMGDFWVHCGMITYVRRDRLGRKIAKVGKGTAKKINRMMGMELGIINKPHDFREDEPSEPDYKKMYDAFLNKLVKAGVKV